MKTIIIEDDISALRVLKNLIQDHCPDLQIIDTASNVQEGIQLIQKTSPELVFLDVEMPQGTSFDILQAFPRIDFKIIFTTAHEKYALKAIKFSALDYLLKPIDTDEFTQAIDKVRHEMQKEITNLKVSTLLQNLTNPSNLSKQIILKDKYGVQPTNIEDIIRLEASGSYTQFFIEGQNSIVTSKVLKEYAALLPEEYFFRCHQSHLVNLNYLLRYDKRDGDFLILKNGHKVPLAMRKKELLMNKLNQR